MSEDRITFNCTTCSHPVSIDNDAPPNDDEIISCMGCGKKFGLYSQVKQAMIDAGKAEIDRIVKETLGVKPTWTNK
jgi:transcription elongation factor Elf1